MASSTFCIFNDSSLYQAAVRATNAQVLVTAKGDFRAELAKIDLRQLWMQRGRERLSRVSRAQAAKQRASIFFLTELDQAPMHHSGTEISPGELVVYDMDSMHTHLSRGPCSWGSMSLSPNHLASISYALVGRELTVPNSTYIFRPVPALMSRLLTLHKAAGELAQFAANLLAHPEVARALEQMLLHAMVTCLTEGIPIKMGSAARRHLLVIKRLEEFFETNYNRPLYLAEICTAIFVSERTLRQCCQEHLGMGPVRYLWLRRMHLARRALMVTNPALSTVAQVATDYGFWELGRFSVQYRALFGEPPSRTLHESKANRPRPDNPLVLPFSDSA